MATLLITAVTFIPLTTGMEGVQVAIYSDGGILAASRLALHNMFEWMHAEVSIIDAVDINGGILDTVDILVMPGGCWCSDRCLILGEEMDIIRDFIENGGSYFGIDGGASYATSYRLDIFHGILCPDACGSGHFLQEVAVNTNLNIPDLSQEPESYEILYEDSGYFNAEDMSSIATVATYVNTSLSCMIVFKFGNGTVFLSSPHPEYEEGSDRDGTDIYDSLLDPDSEWDFMLRICEWLVDES
ncbi:MAG: BPL-N domain-containing protein [Candidatus Thorarchaeota archaeon]